MASMHRCGVEEVFFQRRGEPQVQPLDSCGVESGRFEFSERRAGRCGCFGCKGLERDCDGGHGGDHVGMDGDRHRSVGLVDVDVADRAGAAFRT